MQFEKARFWTIRDIEKIINTNSTEYKTLEFKSLEALVPGSKDEIGKDVSSFANSAGGVIIYGVSEIKTGPDIVLKLDEGRDANDPYGKEWLENIIESNISPKINDLLINPIKLPQRKIHLCRSYPAKYNGSYVGVQPLLQAQKLQIRAYGGL